MSSTKNASKTNELIDICNEAESGFLDHDSSQEFVFEDEIPRSESMIFTPNRPFHVHDLLDAQKDSEHWVHSVIEEKGRLYDVKRSKNTKGSIRFSMPFKKLAEYTISDCVSLNDYTAIKDLLALAPKPANKQETLLKNILMAFHSYYSDGKHSQSWVHLKDVLIPAAKSGHLGSRKNIIKHYLFDPLVFPELSMSVIESWIHSLVDAKYKFEPDFYANIYWAKKMGRIKRISLNSAYDLITDDHDNHVWSIGGARLDANMLPKKGLIEFRDKIADQIARFTTVRLKNDLSNELKRIKKDTDAFMVKINPKFYIFCNPSIKKNQILMVGKDPQGSIFEVSLDTSKPKKVQAFFDSLNGVIEFIPKYRNVAGRQFLMFAEE